MNQEILLVGAGPMAVEYAKVLLTLKIPFKVIGRGLNSATQFESATKVKVVTGGIEKFISQKNQVPKKAIIAVSEEQLGKVTRDLVGFGIKLILVEKPAGLDFEDVLKTEKQARKFRAKVYVAYNRRFYTSVEKALEIIKKDGGIVSLYFDFTELGFRIAPLAKAPGVKENWFLQNSSHVIDLAFFLAGLPKTMKSFVSGKLPWHRKAAVFVGSGVTERGIPFSYHANWGAPGGWNIEIMTKKNKLVFKPLEKLQTQPIGSFEVKEVKINNIQGVEFKTGLYAEIKSFLGNKNNLCTLKEQLHNLKFYQCILNGGTI